MAATAQRKFGNLKNSIRSLLDRWNCAGSESRFADGACFSTASKIGGHFEERSILSVKRRDPNAYGPTFGAED
jgi:hypothetical protein